jgi:phosphoribosyl-AMP cyclohydrolase / phosphoribosyl-ATP pyrophosphohydrolase
MEHKMLSSEEIAFHPADGLVPAIIQDHKSKQVLMLGYMNREAFEKTCETGKVTFYSRSKKRLWMKGEKSGNILRLVRIQEDCDHDALLVEAEPAGPTCHKGETSCFHRYSYEMPDMSGGNTGKSGTAASGDLAFLLKLQDLLRDRKATLPENSYTGKMFRSGRDKLAQKVGEEAVETIIAAKNSEKELVYEASDLLFHLMMLLTGENLKLQDLVSELEKRHK